MEGFGQGDVVARKGRALRLLVLDFEPGGWMVVAPSPKAPERRLHASGLVLLERAMHPRIDARAAMRDFPPRGQSGKGGSRDGRWSTSAGP